MKITINSIHSIALWKWNLKHNSIPPSTRIKIESGGEDLEGKQQQQHQVEEEEESESEEDEDEDDVCGICRIAYDGCCPDCKTPGDECPLIWGECTHVFHMHCLLKWINTESSKQQCPMDRRPWVTADALKFPMPTGTPIPRIPRPNGEVDEDAIVV